MSYFFLYLETIIRNKCDKNIEMTITNKQSQIPERAKQDNRKNIRKKELEYQYVEKDK